MNGPKTPPRFSALLLKASIVPRAELDSPATIVCIPGVPNQVPNAQIAKTPRASGRAEVVNGSRKAAEPEQGDPGQHDPSRTDPCRREAAGAGRNDPDHADDEVGQAGLLTGNPERFADERARHR